MCNLEQLEREDRILRFRDTIDTQYVSTSAVARAARRGSDIGQTEIKSTPKRSENRTRTGGQKSVPKEKVTLMKDKKARILWKFDPEEHEDYRNSEKFLKYEKGATVLVVKKDDDWCVVRNPSTRVKSFVPTSHLILLE